MINITVLTLVDRIACFYSLYPFFTNTDKRFSFTYTSDPDWCLSKDGNRILIMMRQFIKPDYVDLDMMTSLRAKYERIAFFHDDAGGGIPRLSLLPYVDVFYTKALFRDRSLYGRQLYGKELYSDYYHRKYGVVDSDCRDRSVVRDAGEIGKLRLSWNIGVGNYPRSHFRQRTGVALSRVTRPDASRFFYVRDRFDPDRAIADNGGLYQVHARFGQISRPSISYQRKLILDVLGNRSDFLTGMVSQKRFNRETAHSKLVISPFGWGEICLRDFETIRSAALLLKPDMSHLETWPDIFIPGATYVPFSWDADDLIEKARYYLTNSDKRLAIVRRAAVKYRDDLNELQNRFSSIMEEIAI